MDSITLEAKNSSGKQELEISIDEDGDVYFTLFGDYNGKEIQIDFNSLNKHQWKKFVNCVNKIDDKLNNKDTRNTLYNLACDKIKQAKQKCITNYCTNKSGTLWESLWKYENGSIMQKTCCSGLFNDWYTFDNEQQAIDSMIKELETIEKVRAEG